MIELTFSEAPPPLNNLYPTGKNGRRFLSPRGKAWRARAGHELNLQRPEHIIGPVYLDIAIADAVGGDLDGRAKCLIDLLVGHFVIEEDHRWIVRRIVLSWDAAIKGCRVRIQPVAVELDRVRV